MGTPDLAKSRCFTSGTHRTDLLENLGHVSSVPCELDKILDGISVLSGKWDGF